MASPNDGCFEIFAFHKGWCLLRQLQPVQAAIASIFIVGIIINDLMSVKDNQIIWRWWFDIWEFSWMLNKYATVAYFFSHNSFFSFGLKPDLLNREVLALIILFFLIHKNLSIL